jgi:hypothetical protein
MIRRVGKWALAGFGLYQAIGLAYALTHPELFVLVYTTTLAAIEGRTP